MKQWHRVIEIAIRGQDNSAKSLCSSKHRFIICPVITNFVKANRLMSARPYEIRGRYREILVKHELHNAVANPEYGISSNCASEPAKAKTADKSSAVTLG